MVRPVNLQCLMRCQLQSHGVEPALSAMQGRDQVAQR